jgi:diguanylate cyclase (GGDEF)-like protein
VNRAADLATAAVAIRRALSEIVGAPVLLQLDIPAPPAPDSASPEEQPPSGTLEAHRRATRPGPLARPPTPAGGAQVPLGEHGRRTWMILLPGDWTSRRAARFQTTLRESLTAALAAPALRNRADRAEHVASAAYAFSRGLTYIEGSNALHRFIIDTIARATRARLGSLALYDEAEGRLRVAATHGYPSLLVEHVRLAPGEGILGRVFESRRALLVRDVRELPGAQPRPRYHTSSFLAVPLVTGETALGVLTFADRADDEAFDEGDLSAARTLVAPAALALLNDRLVDQSRQLAHAATIDPLTGLFNRRHFESRIEEEIERARRYGLDLSLLMIDIDDFKQINDTLGHLAGDYLLKQVADILKRSVRVFDVCTRYGGEEFAVLMPGSNRENALAVAERIRSRVASAARDGGPLPTYVRITVSLGLAVLAEERAAQDLIGRADRALYRAKAEGKNRVRVEE